MASRPLVSMFRAADGRPFEVRWVDEATAGELWQWNDAHNPMPFSPMTAAIIGNQRQALAAYEEAGVDPPHLFEHFEIHHGFQYTRQTPYSGEQLVQFVAKSRALAARFGGACNVWEGSCLPRVREICAWLQTAPAETPIETLSAAFNRVLHLSHVAGPTLFAPLHARLSALLGPHFGRDELPLVIQEIGQGADNSTVEAERGIAELARIARAEPDLFAAITSGAAAELAWRVPEFAAAFKQYLDEFGWRTETWSMDSPALRERPEVVLDMVRSALKGDREPDERRAGAASVREEALGRVRERLAGEPASLAEVEAIAAELGGYVAVREGRARWQLTAAGSLRHALLAKGEAMADGGVLDRGEDILFLLPAEVDPFFGAGLRDATLKAVVAERRAVRDSWLATTPPRVISTNPAYLTGPAASEANTIRGIAASRGTVTAPARVMENVDQADEMQPGEVLVCVMTAPPWMPLIGLAAAVVTDSGAALSHSAIAAREYGIPAVVGTGDATLRIRTGDTLTVDGTAGTVTVCRAVP